MNTKNLLNCASRLGIAIAASCLIVSGCVYEVPITAKPTRPIDARLLGNWTSPDGKDKMKVVKLDDSHYIVSKNGDLFRVYHSDVANTPLVTVQILDSDKPTYSYYTWNLSDDGTLHVRLVNDKIIPDDTKSSSRVQKLLKKNLQNLTLFGEEGLMTKDK